LTARHGYPRPTAIALGKGRRTAFKRLISMHSRGPSISLQLESHPLRPTRGCGLLRHLCLSVRPPDPLLRVAG
jgi:hypothetical protein